jgi:hypothetical protein
MVGGQHIKTTHAHRVVTTHKPKTTTAAHKVVTTHTPKPTTAAHKVVTTHTHKVVSVFGDGGGDVL